MSGCTNYAENLWKKGKCSNCFRSKDEHFIETKDRLQCNGEDRRSKINHEASKKLTSQSNGHHIDKGQVSTKIGVDGGEFILKKSFNSGKILRTQGTESFTKTRLSYQTTEHNSSNDKNTSTLKTDNEMAESVDKPRPVPRCKPRSSSKNESLEEDILKSVSCVDDSKSATALLKETSDQPNETNSKITDIRTEKLKPGNSVNSNSIQTDLNRKLSSNENGPTTIEGVKLESKNEPIDSNINVGNLKSESLSSAQPSKDRKSTLPGREIDNEYMPMRQNVCVNSLRDRSTDNSKKVDGIKIAASKSIDKNDSLVQEIKNKNDSIDNPNKQQSDESHNNVSTGDSGKTSIAVTNQPKTFNECDKKSSNSPPFYENRRSVETDRSKSTISDKSRGKPPVNISSPSDRPESLAFKVQVDLEEVLRSSSIFEDIIIESSNSSCNSPRSDSIESYNSSGSPVENKSNNSPVSKGAMSDSRSSSFNSPPISNPDVTKLVEGPSYVNSDAKPQTKPYKVVDISAGVLVSEQDADGNNIPPLPPKEKELNRQKETSGSSDHYYYEPPDDVVPDYKKLTPLSNEPPPLVIIKKDGQGVTVPASLKSMPIPRPRSQLPSHSSTLPRPIPRLAKPTTEAKESVNRPVSQVVTRPTNTDAPRPPSTSSIPSRKHPNEVSPPTSPTGKTNSPERNQTKDNNTSIDSKDVKPRRTAPPPPLAVPQSTAQSRSKSPITPTDPKKDYSKPISSPSPSKMDQSSHSKSTIQSGKSTIKRALSSWKRLSGRRKNKRKLEISSPVMVSEDSDSTSQGEDSRCTSPAICTRMKKRESTIPEQDPPEDPPQETKTPEPEKTVSPSVPGRKGRSYQNFPFSKSNVEKPMKPDRHPKVKPVAQAKPQEGNQNEAAAYLEPCTENLTLKVEAALANLNDAKILAETLSRVEQEKLGPLPQIPKSKHVHFRVNETVNKNGEASPVTHVALDSGDKKAVNPSRPPNVKPREVRSNTFSGKGREESNTRSGRSRSSSTQETMKRKRHERILELHRQTLLDMIESCKEELLPGDTIDLSNTRWYDYEVCGRPLDIQCPGAVLLPVVVPRIDEELPLLAKVKIPKSVTEDMSQRKAFMQDMATTVSLPFHANVSRTITHFTDHFPAKIFGVQNSTNFETLVTITDQVPVETVQEFVERTGTEHKELPDEYERKVCILVLQLLSALEHLHREGVVHRGLTLNNLLLIDHGHLVLSNFSHVLQKSGGDASSQQFHFKKETIGKIGEDPNRIPPEIHKAYNDNQPIDFEKCDIFSTGCLIYEFLHHTNPFAVDSKLLSRDYTAEDLPVLAEVSRFTSGLALLASSLLQRDTSMRMLPHDALKLLQAFLWGPEELDETCLEVSATDWLEAERAQAVIDIARTQSLGEPIGGEEILENFLRYQYLVNLTEEEVVDSYKALEPASQA